jgi:hypothetical protein
MNVFDTNTYPRPENPEHCFICGKPFGACRKPSDAYRKQFKEMTGRRYPGPVSYNLYRDFTSLNLDTVHTPDRATFCLVCSVDSMLEFNRRLSEKKHKASQQLAPTTTPIPTVSA